MAQGLHGMSQQLIYHLQRNKIDPDITTDCCQQPEHELCTTEAATSEKKRKRVCQRKGSLREKHNMTDD